jgi:NADH dehydrogenase
LASIGHRTGVAIVFGIKFSGIVAWWFWRTLYLLKLPGLAKKLRVVLTWTIDIFFGREIEQMITRHEVEVLSGRLAQIRKHVTQP